MQLVFPDGFRWGVATSSYQFEGHSMQNQWYRWEQDGHIKSGERSNLACDWWDNAERDFDLAQHMGLNALRLSLEWSRIQPERGSFDAAALQRYRQMLIALRVRGIEPMVTLHHFTNPLWFEDSGGFLAHDAVSLFERYVRTVVEALDDECDFWCTINEPNVYAVMGYLIGDFPPGKKGDIQSVIRVQANLARAHAAAYRAIHAVQPHARVGWAQNVNIFDPANGASRLDRWAAKQQDRGFNAFFLDVVRDGRAGFPYDALVGDVSMVKGTLDYIGINCYSRDLVQFDLSSAGHLFGKRFPAPQTPRGDPGIGSLYGEIFPQGISRTAQRVANFRVPVYITENGVADRADRLRPWVLTQAMLAMQDALRNGVDIRGYYHWSLVDNFEWADGWTMRFGLYDLDPVTQVRTQRRSGAYYSAIARANGLSDALLQEYGGDHLFLGVH